MTRNCCNDFVRCIFVFGISISIAVCNMTLFIYVIFSIFVLVRGSSDFEKYVLHRKTIEGLNALEAYKQDQSSNVAWVHIDFCGQKHPELAFSVMENAVECPEMPIGWELIMLQSSLRKMFFMQASPRLVNSIDLFDGTLLTPEVQTWNYIGLPCVKGPGGEDYMINKDVDKPFFKEVSNVIFIRKTIEVTVVHCYCLPLSEQKHHRPDVWGVPWKCNWIHEAASGSNLRDGLEVRFKVRLHRL